MSWFSKFTVGVLSGTVLVAVIAAPLLYYSGKGGVAAVQSDLSDLGGAITDAIRYTPDQAPSAQALAARAEAEALLSQPSILEQIPGIPSVTELMHRPFPGIGQPDQSGSFADQFKQATGKDSCAPEVLAGLERQVRAYMQLECDNQDQVTYGGHVYGLDLERLSRADAENLAIIAGIEPQVMATKCQQLDPGKLAQDQRYVMEKICQAIALPAQ
ncbi:MAG: hypothetical protein AAGF56_13830 [Pseudomonadota bacterium]